MAVVFQLSCVIVRGTLACGVKAAVEEEVSTKRLIDGTLLAACRMSRTPAMVPGIMALGSAENETSPATCAMPAMSGEMCMR